MRVEAAVLVCHSSAWTTGSWVRAEDKQLPARGRRKHTAASFLFSDITDCIFRNHAGWLSVFLTEGTDMAFTCQREVSVRFGSSSSAVYTLRTSFRDQLSMEQTLLAYKWSVGQGSHHPTLMLLSRCQERKPRLGSRALGVTGESLQTNRTSSVSSYNLAVCLRSSRRAVYRSWVRSVSWCLKLHYLCSLKTKS